MYWNSVTRVVLLIGMGFACLVEAFVVTQAEGKDKAATTQYAIRNTQYAVAQAPPIYLGIDSYRHWDKLSYLEVGDRVWGQSTADPGGSNLDNSHIMRILNNGERVLFDQVGPGVMTWMRHQQDYGSPWRLYLDGNLTTIVGPGDLGQINPTTFPARAFPYPLSMHTGQTQGSSILAATIPFNDGMMWTAANPNGNFYSLYRKMPYGTPLTTWTGSEPVTDVVQLLRKSGSDIAPTNIPSQSGVVNLSAGETTIATIIGGPSQLRAIKFRVPFNDKVRFGNSRLRIYWDGESTPSVDAPVKFMAGDGAGVYQPAGRALVQGLLVAAGGDGGLFMDFNLYWPMPFTSTARIAIFTTAIPSIDNVVWSVRYELFSDPPGWWGKFHANYTSIPVPPFGEDMVFLDVAGSGRLVGTVVNFTAPDIGLEGDPHFFIDDNNTPQIQVTGTEEWGTGGNYWNGGNQTSLPVGGLPSSVNNPQGEDVDGAALYRLLVADTVPFNSHLVVRWEHGIDNNFTQYSYRAAVFWYGTPVQTALLSDDLDIGDSASRVAHGYESPSEQPYTLTAAYEYPVHNPLSTATGISMTTVSTFTMALDPANVGAFLRRQFDYGAANQRARIYVDGDFAGTWYSASSFNGTDIDGRVRRWREEEFPLPASMTSGKSSVTVRVERVVLSDPPSSVWTEFRYKMYSFVMPPGSEPNTPTPTVTVTATATATTTASSTLTPTATATVIATPSETATGTPTVSQPTSTSTNTQTATMTPIITPTLPSTSTATSTATTTGTATGTPTSTSTATPSATPSPTNVPATTALPSSTATTTRISTPTSTPVCGGGWSIVDSPNPSTTFNHLFGMDAASSTDLWAVGYFTGASGGQTLALHGNGNQWTHVPTPNRGTDQNILTSVADIYANDAWAVGWSHSQGNGWLTLTEHWDGSQWSIVPSPNADSVESYLLGISAIANDDIWAVGYYVGVIGGLGVDRTFTLHWDGSAWNIVSSPNIGTANNQLKAVTAISANDVWAAGYHSGGDTLVEHWDGNQWLIVSSPNPIDSEGAVLNSISATSSNDVWAAGGYSQGPGVGASLIEHWDGQQWSIAPSPNPLSIPSSPSSLSSSKASTLPWLHGSAPAPGEGLGLSQGPGREPGQRKGLAPEEVDTSPLYGVAAISANDAWAVGYHCCGVDGLTTLTEHWDGQAWSIMESPNASNNDNYIEAVAAVSSTDVWVAGEWDSCLGCPIYTLTEHYAAQCPSPTPTATLTATGTSTATASLTNTPANSATTTSTSTVVPPTACAIEFSDVPQGSTFYMFIRCLACRGIVSGYGDGTFRPGNDITRGQIAKVVSNAAALGDDAGEQIYEDVPPGDTFYAWINRLSRRGYMGGYPCGTVPGEECVLPGNRPYFRPTAGATRGQIAKIVANAAGVAGTPSGLYYTDVPEDNPFYLWVMRLTDLGAMGGYPCGSPGEPCDGEQRPYFRPFSNVTRGQSAKIVANTFFPGCATP